VSVVLAFLLIYHALDLLGSRARAEATSAHRCLLIGRKTDSDSDWTLQKLSTRAALSKQSPGSPLAKLALVTFKPYRCAGRTFNSPLSVCTPHFCYVIT
jgi:hypothetical protein